MQRVPVSLGARSYDILVGTGLIAQAGRRLQDLLARRRTVVVTDSIVAAHHLEPLRAGLAEAGIGSESVILPPGEKSKSFAPLEALLERLLALEVERQDAILALGGGVIGDLAGFAAAVLRRGVGYVQIPTTLLAQVDSAIGGKTAINSVRGKNLIGAFHQPRRVLCDVSVLRSLPARELRAGYAEVVKYALLGDAPFFAWLEENHGALLACEPAALRHAVVESCRHKARIVAADERETGERALLNLGHTFGHAIEAEAGYDGRVLHGEAVAVGMVMAAALSARLGALPAADLARIRAHLTRAGLPTTVRALGLAGCTAERLLQHMRQDKKVQGGRLTLVLLRALGQAYQTRDVEAEAIEAVLREELAA